MTIIEVEKDEDNQLPIPSEWRQLFVDIVNSFVIKDYLISSGIDGVSPVSKETAVQIEEYITDYGENLIALPSETWESSICLYMGDSWDILIDLWTESEGRSDLALSATVKESESGYIVHVGMVYVP